VQFNPETVLWHRLAQGQVGQPVRPLPQEKSLQAGHRFEEPVKDAFTLAAALGRLAATLAGRLQAAGQEGRTLSLLLETEGGRHEASLVLRRPTGNAERLADALKELLGGVHLEQSATALTVVVGGLEPTAGRQMALFGQADVLELALDTLHNVAAKHGAGCLLRPKLLDADHPFAERRFQLEALT
jgi:hypothetical protein